MSQVTAMQLSVLAWWKEQDEPKIAAECCEAMGFSYIAMREHLRKLRDAGLMHSMKIEGQLELVWAADPKLFEIYDTVIIPRQVWREAGSYPRVDITMPVSVFDTARHYGAHA